ncbi:PcsB-like coiled-coil domain-containing protein [Peribacillus sp. NPDC097197]|uniref:C40 family peptidase n=1 Tax=Peribacillus sp. NPDC097197 TaxID=3390615 RepID=UPI003D014850
MSLKKKLIVLNTTIMLGLGSIFAAPMVNAESVSDIQSERAGIQSDISDAEKVIQDLQKEQAKMDSRIKEIVNAMEENDKKIKKTNIEVTETEKDIDSLKKEITALEERIEKREEILKERALSFQESGGDVNYLEVVLGSTSFRDLVDRVGAVAAIVEADQEILTQQEADKAELEAKHEEVEKKLQSLKEMQVDLKGMKSQIKEQKAASVKMKSKLEKKQSETEALKKALQNEDADLAGKLATIRENIKKEEERKAAEKAELNRVAEEVQKTSTNHVDDHVDDHVDSNVAPSTSSSKNESSSSSPKSSPKNNVSTTPKSESKATAAPSTANVGSAITAGYKYIGNSTYVFGGGRTASDIANGRFDCSAFVAWAYKQAGVNLPPSTGALTGAGKQVSKSQMQPGDLVFFNTYKTDGHVGIYVGGGKFIGSQSSTGVAVANMSSGYWASKFNGRVVRVK